MQISPIKTLQIFRSTSTCPIYVSKKDSALSLRETNSMVLPGATGSRKRAPSTLVARTCIGWTAAEFAWFDLPGNSKGTVPSDRRFRVANFRDTPDIREMPLKNGIACGTLSRAANEFAFQIDPGDRIDQKKRFAVRDYFFNISGGIRNRGQGGGSVGKRFFSKRFQELPNVPFNFQAYGDNVMDDVARFVDVLFCQCEETESLNRRALAGPPGSRRAGGTAPVSGFPGPWTGVFRPMIR